MSCFLKVAFSFTMFGDLFEEDHSSVSDTRYANGKKLKTKALDPPAPREFTKLSGIRNQGGTCYLNSLLQTLHFTPEFRGMLPYLRVSLVISNPPLYTELGKIARRQSILKVYSKACYCNTQSGNKLSYVYSM